jgi:NAD dependent epimerase/dehydratase family enzyme
MAEEALLSSQKVLPKHLVAAGYPFQYPEIRQALEDVF